MSHTTTVKAKIKDARAIRSAVAELKAAGAKIELLTNVKPRMFYEHQHPQASDLVIKCEGRYDVGLDKQTDGTYNLAFDAWGGDISKQIGNNKVTGNQSPVAKFLQSYGKHAAINAAMAKGYTVTGTTVDAKGNVNILVNVPG